MKYLVIFKSKYGTTEKTAKTIQEIIGNDCVIKELEKNKDYDIEIFDSIMIGTAVYAGNILDIVANFFNKNKQLLMNKDFSIFVHALDDDKVTLELLRKAMGDQLFEKARCIVPLGARVQLHQHNFFMRLILKQIAKKSGRDFTNFDTTGREKILKFINIVRENNYESM